MDTDSSNWGKLTTLRRNHKTTKYDEKINTFSKHFIVSDETKKKNLHKIWIMSRICSLTSIIPLYANFEALYEIVVVTRCTCIGTEIHINILIGEPNDLYSN